ncbi:CTP:molybdopterin cytidylyltransferase MocA [Microbacterium sp. 1154]|uniref:nucleotidyltransferase family protein n=1 Tax=Microbacterium sp. 1154 TaxID=2817733 RepID=UPI002859977D|nr:NTP transferase domain-containing protein [Microbacterium sp. 1154]MDR6689850.1 CTP:molybdopterin cytidylyltransferase MocA [Microbacterium sp. 1154]
MPAAPVGTVSGLVLAAGAGRRFGGPKALARTAAGTPWIALAARALTAGGCHDVTVVLGAEADAAAALVPTGVTIVRADDWVSGVAASLRAGLQAVASGPAVSVVVLPVDTPEVPGAAIARVARRAAAGALVQATYDGAPGHPVLLGRDHWGPVAASIRGDIGARAYLIAQEAQLVECGDLWSGADHDVR